MTQSTNFALVSRMNTAFNNLAGDPRAIDWPRVRSQSCNIMDEFIELMGALGLSDECLETLKAARKTITPDAFKQAETPNLDDVRDALCDINVFSYGSHHFMGLDADKDMRSVVNGVMTRFIKDDADKAATIALHAAKGVTDVYFEGEYPVMIMKSASNQPDAPRGKFLKSASCSGPTFYNPSSATAEAIASATAA